MLDIIELTVRGQALTADKVCVASGLINEMECHIATDWEVDEIRAVFYNDGSRGVMTSVVVTNGICLVPAEALKDKGSVYVNLVGSVSDGITLVERMTSYKTKIIEVRQKVYTDGANTETPTPSEFEQFVAVVDEHIEERTLPDAPSDGKTYGRKDGTWSEVTGGGGSASWGDIAGDIEDQTDLIEMINGVEAEIPSLTGYATEDYVDGAIADAIGGAINGLY